VSRLGEAAQPLATNIFAHGFLGWYDIVGLAPDTANAVTPAKAGVHRSRRHKPGD